MTGPRLTKQANMPIEQKIDDAAHLLYLLADTYVLRVIQYIGTHIEVTTDILKQELREKAFMACDAHDIIDCGVLRRKKRYYELNPDMPPIAKAIILAIWPEFAPKFLPVPMSVKGERDAAATE